MRYGGWAMAALAGAGVLAALIVLAVVLADEDAGSRAEPRHGPARTALPADVRSDAPRTMFPGFSLWLPEGAGPGEPDAGAVGSTERATGDGAVRVRLRWQVEETSRGDLDAVLASAREIAGAHRSDAQVFGDDDHFGALTVVSDPGEVRAVAVHVCRKRFVVHVDARVRAPADATDGQIRMARGIAGSVRCREPVPTAIDAPLPSMVLPTGFGRLEGATQPSFVGLDQSMIIVSYVPGDLRLTPDDFAASVATAYDADESAELLELAVLDEDGRTADGEPMLLLEGMVADEGVPLRLTIGAFFCRQRGVSFAVHHTAPESTAQELGRQRLRGFGCGPAPAPDSVPLFSQVLVGECAIGNRDACDLAREIGVSVDKETKQK